MDGRGHFGCDRLMDGQRTRVVLMRCRMWFAQGTISIPALSLMHLALAVSLIGQSWSLSRFAFQLPFPVSHLALAHFSVSVSLAFALTVALHTGAALGGRWQVWP